MLCTPCAGRAPHEGPLRAALPGYGKGAHVPTYESEHAHELAVWPRACTNCSKSPAERHCACTCNDIHMRKVLSRTVCTCNDTRARCSDATRRGRWGSTGARTCG